MEDNKLLNNMEKELDEAVEAEVVTETSEPALETEETVEATEMVEETDYVEEALEEAEEIVGNPEEDLFDEQSQTFVESDFEVNKSKKNTAAVIAVAAVIVVVAILLGVNAAIPKNYTVGDIYAENRKISEKAAKENKNNKEANTKKYNSLGYENVSGLTIGEWCEENSIDFERFVTQYNLPADITEDTYFDVAQYMMPAWVMSEMYGTDFATLKENFELPDKIQVNITNGGLFGLFSKGKTVEMEINENMPWGLIYDEVTLKVLVGEDGLEKFKEEYGFGDEITLDTKWKEVRPILEKKEKEAKEQEEAAAEAEGAEFEGDEGVENAPETTDETTDAAVEETETAQEEVVAE